MATDVWTVSSRTAQAAGTVYGASRNVEEWRECQVFVIATEVNGTLDVDLEIGPDDSNFKKFPTTGHFATASMAQITAEGTYVQCYPCVGKYIRTKEVIASDTATYSVVIVPKTL